MAQDDRLVRRIALITAAAAIDIVATIVIAAAVVDNVATEVVEVALIGIIVLNYLYTLWTVKEIPLPPFSHPWPSTRRPPCP